MKYIDAEKLKAEIERLRDEYTDIAIDSHYGTVNANHVVADLEQLLSFLNTLLEQPMEGLEEAAENYRRKSYNAAIIPSVDGPTNEYGGSVKSAFIAGAKWQKEQMMKEVDEMDLEKEINSLDDAYFDLDGIAVKGATYYVTVEDLKDIARHFYELGLKAIKEK